METEAAAVSLRDLFDDLVEHQRYRHALESTVLTFEDRSGTYITIIASKSFGRYRIQSDSLQALNLLLNELEMRLKLFHEQKSSEKNSKICGVRLKVTDK